MHTGKITGNTTGRQLNLFQETDYEKLADLDRSVDTLRNRFGTDAVMRAVFLNQPIDHMSGGITREKMSVDYDKAEIL